MHKLKGTIGPWEKRCTLCHLVLSDLPTLVSKTDRKIVVTPYLWSGHTILILVQSLILYIPFVRKGPLIKRIKSFSFFFCSHKMKVKEERKCLHLFLFSCHPRSAPIAPRMEGLLALSVCSHSCSHHFPFPAVYGWVGGLHASQGISLCYGAKTRLVRQCMFSAARGIFFHLFCKNSWPQNRKKS